MTDKRTVKWDMHGAEATVIQESGDWLLTEPSVGGSMFRPYSIGYCIWHLVGEKEKSEFLIADFKKNKNEAELYLKFLSAKPETLCTCTIDQYGSATNPNCILHGGK